LEAKGWLGKLPKYRVNTIRKTQTQLIREIERREQGERRPIFIQDQGALNRVRLIIDSKEGRKFRHGLSSSLARVACWFTLLETNKGILRSRKVLRRITVKKGRPESCSPRKRGKPVMKSKYYCKIRGSLILVKTVPRGQTAKATWGMG